MIIPDSLPAHWRRALMVLVGRPSHAEAAAAPGGGREREGEQEGGPVPTGPHRRAWMTRGGLVRCYGVEPRALDELRAAGWIQDWPDYPAGEAWTLTAVGADRLGVEMDERAEGDPRGGDFVEVPYWRWADEPALPVRIIPLRGECRCPFPERVVDPAGQGGEMAADDAPRAEGEQEGDDGQAGPEPEPEPIPWPEPEPEPAGLRGGLGRGPWKRGRSCLVKLGGLTLFGLAVEYRQDGPRVGGRPRKAGRAA